MKSTVVLAVLAALAVAAPSPARAGNQVAVVIVLHEKAGKCEIQVKDDPIMLGKTDDKVRWIGASTCGADAKIELKNFKLKSTGAAANPFTDASTPGAAVKTHNHAHFDKSIKPHATGHYEYSFSVYVDGVEKTDPVLIIDR